MVQVKRFIARIDLGWLAVLAICFLAIWPFISRSALPQETDAELHIYRLAELSRVIRSGHLFPRWAPNFYYGFGYPIFNYYAPLTYYLGLAVDLLPVLSPVTGVKAVFVLGLLFAGVGMYGFVRDWWGRRAGMLAAAVFVYAPYIQFVDPHARGDLAEAFSFGLFPMAMWSLSRLRLRPTHWNWFASCGLVAAIIMTHNLMAMVFFGILLAWAIWQHLFLRSDHISTTGNPSSSWLWRSRLSLALFLGVGLASVFWLVVALEQDAVNLASLIGDGGHFDFRNHFLSWRELLAGPSRLDWRATEPDFSLNLGLGQWLLGGLGLFLFVVGRVRAMRQAAFFAAGLLFLLFLMLPQSAFLWERLPLLPFLQFPWRLLGPATAMLAVLSGAGLSGLMTPAKRWQAWLPAALVTGIMMLALPLSQVPPWPEKFGPTSARRVVEIELSGRWLGTTSTADFVPITVETMPKPEQSLLEDFFAVRPLDRVNRVTLPPGTTVEGEELSLLHSRYHVAGVTDFPLRLFLYDFPGWQATVDGQPMTIELGRPEGFIVVPVPAGEHVVDVRFGTTRPRSMAAIVSGISLILVLAITWRFKRSPELTDPPPALPDTRSDNRAIWLVATAALVIVLLNGLVIEPMGFAHLNSQNFEAIPAARHEFVNFGGQVALIGSDVPAGSHEPGEVAEIRLYWQALQPLTINYQVFVHLLNEDGVLVAQSDKLNPGDFPTKRWPGDKYVRDEHLLTLPPDLPPGDYKISVGLWVSEEGWRLPVIDSNGRQVGDQYLLPDIIQVIPPD